LISTANPARERKSNCGCHLWRPTVPRLMPTNHRLGCICVEGQAVPTVRRVSAIAMEQERRGRHRPVGDAAKDGTITRGHLLRNQVEPRRICKADRSHHCTCNDPARRTLPYVRRPGALLPSGRLRPLHPRPAARARTRSLPPARQSAPSADQSRPARRGLYGSRRRKRGSHYPRNAATLIRCRAEFPAVRPPRLLAAILAGASLLPEMAGLFSLPARRGNVAILASPAIAHRLSPISRFG
jgi:hypothetical protein